MLGSLKTFRRRVGAFIGGFEAGLANRRLRGFQPSRAHLNTLIAAAGPDITARARWLVRNNGYAANAIESWAGNVVGASIKPSSLIADPELKARVQKLWLAWTDEADAEGFTDFYGLQRRAAREVFIAGEVFFRFRPRRPQDGLTVPLQLQMLPSEMLPLNRNEVAPGGNVIRRREAALVVMGVPERQLLTAMRRTERVVDVEDLLFARLHCRADLVDQSCGEPRRLRLARRILQTTDRRLRGQRCAGGRTAADRDLHQRVMPQPVEVDGILVAARDRRDARHHHLEHLVTDAARIAAIRHRIGKPSAHPELALRLPQQQQTGVRRLVAAVKIHCEFLALDRWQVEGKRCSVGHGGCGARLIRDAIRLNTDLLRESLALRHSRHINLMPRA